MDPRELQISDFAYDLPGERIARFPLPERDLSKLLIYRRGEITEDIYRNIPGFLPENSILFFNNTKVIPARLFFENAKGRKIEIFCLYPAGDEELGSALQRRKDARWQCMVGRANKWKEKTIGLVAEGCNISAEIVDKTGEAFTVHFSWEPEHLTFVTVLAKAGVMPIPPYLKRPSEGLDVIRYQTIFAEKEGSIAAPTAGLHFTDRVFAALKEKQIATEYLTLHVGAGTFKPVKSEIIGGHEMHEEMVEFSIGALERLQTGLLEKEKNAHNSPPVVTVGTTALRALESLYWLALKVKNRPEILGHPLTITQWEPYDIAAGSEKPSALLKILINQAKAHHLPAIHFKTSILIAPGYQPKIANALITNFHQPGSTLLLLIAALLGNDWKRVYDYALTHNFRFLSYGDGSLLIF